MAKKKFNETGFGKFVSKAGQVLPEIIDIGAKAITGNFSGALEEVGDLLGKKKEDSPEATALFHEFEKFKLEWEMEYQREISKRWVSDNENGSWLSKNVRPLTLASLLVVFFFMLFFDGNVGGFEVKKEYLPIYNSLLLTAIGGYFVARSYEKSKK